MIIQIIDIGIGNIYSIQNMLKKAGHESEIVKLPDATCCPDLIILPGVGSFDYAMKRLIETGWRDYLKEDVQSLEIPVLGICLGMQLLCNGSEEGQIEGLSLIPGYFMKFKPNALGGHLKVPNMGWNEVHFCKQASWMAEGINQVPRFYFVHSYYYLWESDEYIWGSTQYGIRYASVINRGSCFGVQFHPEKSHTFGLTLFKNFLKYIQENKGQG